MATHFRLVAAILAAGALVSAGAAFAEWPFSQRIARLEPGYGGVCEDCDLSGRILAGARMTNSVFSHSNFSGAVMSRADGSGSAFEHADFTAADLSKAKLIEARCTGAVFENALLTDSDASGADFTDAQFDHAEMSGVLLNGAILSGADLRSARGLTQAQLRHACGNRATRLPRGLWVERCG